jgi:NADPH:quinone reductase-like Zn-dependent oxidoreductase
MKAAVYDRYGSPPELRDVPKPSPGDNDVLIRVHASSVNSWDWDKFAGTLQGKLESPSKPKNPILGADVAGTVEAVGGRVTRFKPGDAVFGDIAESGWGGFAEYARTAEKYLVLKPDGMSFEQAAAIPQAGLLALQALRKRKIVPGEKVLINGAGGGVGTFAIQMAKHFGAEVTGVDRGEKLDVMRSVGADHVIDFAEVDFTQTGQRYDCILDVTTRHSMFAYARALNPGGRYVVVGGSMRAIFRAVTVGALISLLGGRKIGLLLWHPSTDDLEEMKALFAAGAVVPVIDRTYPLAEAGEALRHVGEGRARGKIVISIAT